MNCTNCKAEWTPPSGVSITQCPFCGKSLYELKDNVKNAEPHEILLKIVQQYDKKKLGDTLLKGMLTDLMPHVEKKYQRIFKQALDDKVGSKLLDLEHEDNSIRIVKIKTLKDSFKNNNGFDQTADYVVDCFLFALGWIETASIEQYSKAEIDKLGLVSQQIDFAFIDGVLHKAEAKALFSSAQSLGFSENEIADMLHAKIKNLKFKPFPEPDKSLKNQKEILCSSDWYSESGYNLIKQNSPNPVAINNFIETFGNLNLEMVFVKGGTFTMGCTSEQSDCSHNEKPTHQVKVSDFSIGKYEVTQKQWQSIMGNNPSHFKGDNLPVETVSWDDIQEFIQKLNQKTGKKYRLPTEAEWEYAARGGSTSSPTLYSGSNNIDEVAWHSGNSGSKTHPVGQKKLNKLGIYDMSGNVWEWCSDWYGDYKSGSQSNPQGPSSGSSRMARGGCWGSDPQYCRVSIRYNGNSCDRDYDVGFRLVLVP
jgi:formylglycine-generating enzyme required for sulfatase activity